MAGVLPLDHLLVLDLTAFRAGPTAVRQLADWGARVITVERPVEGVAPQLQAPVGEHRGDVEIALDVEVEGHQIARRDAAEAEGRGAIGEAARAVAAQQDDGVGESRDLEMPVVVEVEERQAT